MTETVVWLWRASTIYWEALTQCPGTAHRRILVFSAVSVKLAVTQWRYFLCAWHECDVTSYISHAVLCFSGFTHVACDYSSIVASVEGKDGKDVLKAYSFTSWAASRAACIERRRNVWFYYELMTDFTQYYERLWWDEVYKRKCYTQCYGKDVMCDNVLFKKWRVCV